VIRDPAAIGAGLAPARPARAIRRGERIHVVGAAGAGASAAALLAQAGEAAVSGCDPGGPSPYTASLEAARIPLAWAHDPAHVSVEPPPDRLAVTKALTAVAPDHPELTAARERSIPLEPWQQVVADAATGRRLVGVAGTHGKSTTAGWLVHLLVAAGMDPSAFVGALLPDVMTGGLPATARVGTGDVFVVEADEYAGNWDAYRPAIAVVTSLEWDHPDVFANREAVVDAFEAWLARAGDSTDLALVANVGADGVDELVRRIAGWVRRLVTVAVDDAAPGAAVIARITRARPAGTSVSIVGIGGDELTVDLPTAGRHNVANAVCVAAGAALLGVDRAMVATGLTTFPGVGRRLERKGEAAGVVVYDDYGHHPTAIRETIRAVRQREPDRRIWAVYEPLTYHRTAAMLDAFADVLATADGVAIADIWAGRDPDTSVASAGGLADAVARRRPGIEVAAPGSVEETAAWLATAVHRGDAILVMGGGRSYRIAELVLENLAAT
jgi:UDP-N-acetylmuramate--alanine ligase